VLWAATEDGLLKSSDGGSTWNRSDQGSGRYLLKTVAIDPRDGKRMIAGAGGDGIFVSSDGGASWSASSTGLAAGWVERLWGDPRSNVLFAQLSTALYRRDGAAWSEVTDPFTTGEVPDLDGFVFDAANPQTIYALDTSEYWLSSDGGKRFTKVVQKGPGMRQMMKGSTDSVQFNSMAQDRGDAKILYVGSWSNDGPTGAVYKTVDAGKKWAPSGSGLPAEAVPMLRAGAPGTVFALVDDNGLFRTTNGGGAWSAAGSGLPEKIHEVAVSAKTPTQVFVATEEGLYRSTDSGASWTRVTKGLEDDDVEGIAIDPASGNVYAGSFKGVFRSTDGGESFAKWSEGMLHTDVRALAVAGSPPRLWAGTAGGSLYSTDLP